MSNIIMFPVSLQEPMERAQGCTIKWHAMSMCNEHMLKNYNILISVHDEISSRSSN